MGQELVERMKGELKLFTENGFKITLKDVMIVQDLDKNLLPFFIKNVKRITWLGWY